MSDNSISHRIQGRVLSFLERRWLLLAIMALAIIVRSIPGWIHPGWGNDFGIYYGLTKQFAENPQWFQPYDGWGDSYQYFPMLYLITAGVHWLTGWDIALLLSKVAPIFGGLTVVALYALVRSLFGDRRVALIAAALLASNPFHIYQTSHAAPLTIGHFFFLVSLALFIHYPKRPSYTGPLYVSTFLLFASHHLTTYFYLISITAAFFWSNLMRESWTSHARSDAFYVLATTTGAFAYWILYAVPIYRGFMSGKVPLSPGHVVLLYYVAFGVLAVCVHMKHRLWQRWKLRGYKHKPLGPRLVVTRFMIGTIAMGVAIMALIPLAAIVRGFEFSPSASLYLLPFAFIMGLAVVGNHALTPENDGVVIEGILLVMIASFIYFSVANIEAFYSIRHLEYIAIPLCVVSALGIRDLAAALGEPLGKEEDEDLSGQRDDGHTDKVTLKSHLHKPSWAVVFTALLVIVSTISAYPLQQEALGYREVIEQPVFDVIAWMDTNIDRNVTIATDHRIGVLLHAEGFKNVTYDAAYHIWYAENWTGCLDELNGTERFGKVQYILIDEIMVTSGIQSDVNHTPQPLNATTYGKFSQPPFILTHRVEAEDMEEWAELYAVDWSYISEQAG